MNPFANGNFIDDEEKMRDFVSLTKEEFLSSYSYLTEEEYDNTAAELRKKNKGGSMKVKVRMSYTVELVVEGEDMEAISDWMAETTPAEAYQMANGVSDESFDDEILDVVDNNVRANYVIY